MLSENKISKRNKTYLSRQMWQLTWIYWFCFGLLRKHNIFCEFIDKKRVLNNDFK